MGTNAAEDERSLDTDEEMQEIADNLTELDNFNPERRMMFNPARNAGMKTNMEELICLLTYKKYLGKP